MSFTHTHTHTSIYTIYGTWFTECIVYHACYTTIFESQVEWSDQYKIDIYDCGRFKFHQESAAFFCWYFFLFPFDNNNNNNSRWKLKKLLCIENSVLIEHGNGWVRISVVRGRVGVGVWVTDKKIQSIENGK